MSVAQALREPEVFTQSKEELVYEDGLAGMPNPKLVARGAEAAVNEDASASMASKTFRSGVVYHFDREERRRAGKMRIEQLRAEVGAEPL